MSKLLFLFLFFTTFSQGVFGAIQTGCLISDGRIHTGSPTSVNAPGVFIGTAYQYNAGSRLLSRVYCITNTGVSCAVYLQNSSFPGSTGPEPYNGGSFYYALGTTYKFSTNPLDCPLDGYALFSVLLLGVSGFFLIKHRSIVA